MHWRLTSSLAHGAGCAHSERGSLCELACITTATWWNQDICRRDGLGLVFGVKGRFTEQRLPPGAHPLRSNSQTPGYLNTSK